MEGSKIAQTEGMSEASFQSIQKKPPKEAMTKRKRDMVELL